MSTVPEAPTVERLIGEFAEPMRAGNLVAPVRAAVDRLPTASRGQKRLLYGALRDGLRTWLPGGAHPLQSGRLGEILAGYREPDGLDGERVALAQFVAGHHAAPGTPAAGEVTILLAGARPFLGRAFGVVQTLKVAASPWGADLRLVHRGDDADDESFFRGFRIGCMAATSHLRSLLPRGVAAVGASLLIGNYRLHGELPALHVSARGESIGLGAAVAVLSGILGLPTPRDTAFTGRVDLHGALHAVGGLDAKASAAAEVGVKTIVLPATGGGAPPGVSRLSGLTLRRCRDLTEVVAAVFSTDDIASGLHEILARSGEPRPFHAAVTDTRLADRVLLSVVGKSDPVGTLKDRGGRPLGEQDGPVLTICRELRPRRVVLLYTSADGDDANDFRGAARATQRFIEEEDADCTVELKPLDGVADPTDVEILLRVLARRVGEVVSTTSGGPFFYANVTSGTPQMQIAWHLLAVYGVLPARSQLPQIREARYAAADDAPSLRAVTLPVPPLRTGSFGQGRAERPGGDAS